MNNLVRSFEFQKTYLFDHSTKRNFNESIAFCEQHDAKLIQVGSEAEFNFLNSFLPAIYYYIGVVPTWNSLPTHYPDGSKIDLSWQVWYRRSANSRTIYYVNTIRQWATWHDNHRDDGSMTVCQKPIQITLADVQLKVINLYKTISLGVD